MFQKLPEDGFKLKKKLLSSIIIYSNNLYGWVVFQKLPEDSFKLKKKKLL